MKGPAVEPFASVIAPARPSRLRRLHLAFGVGFVLVFLATGQYMDLRYDHLRGLDDTTRMLFRANHIYVLLAALLHVGLGLYLVPQPGRWPAVLQAAGSALVFAATLLFLGGFFVEPFLSDLRRPFTRPGVYGIAVGVLLHLAAAFLAGRTSRRAQA